MKKRYRFLYREGDRYYWEVRWPNVPPHELVSCKVDWFWSGPLSGWETAPQRMFEQAAFDRIIDALPTADERVRRAVAALMRDPD